MILTMIMAIETEEERSFVETIYEKYRMNMLAICCNVLHNQADAEDALVDAFEHIIKTVKSVQAVPKHKLPALLHTYAYNAAIDLYRRNGLENDLFSPTIHHSDNGDTAIDLLDHSINLEQTVLDNALIVEIFHMIEEFPPKVRSVALLKWHYHYKNIEIAQALNISESSVSSHIQHARNRLVKLLSKNYSRL